MNGAEGFALFVRIFCLCTNMMLCMFGLLGFTIYFYTLEFVSGVQCFYMIVFGIMGIFAELHLSKLTKYLGFFKWLAGRGIFYIFAGLLTFRADGGNNVPIAFIIVPFVYLGGGVLALVASCILWEFERNKAAKGAVKDAVSK